MTANGHIAKFEALPSIVFRIIVNVPWYVRNDKLRKNLKIRSVVEEIIRLSDKYKTRLDNHSNDPVKQLCTVNLPGRQHRFADQCPNRTDCEVCQNKKKEKKKNKIYAEG